MGDWTDLVGKVVDNLDILDANVHQPQTTANAVIPNAAGNVSNLRRWNPDYHHLWDTFRTYPREIPLVGGTLVTPNHLKYGVSWRFGGQYNDHGRYIRDAVAWVEVKGIGAAQSFTINADWREPEWEGTEEDPVAKIECYLTVTWEQFWMTEQRWAYHFTMLGDGSGNWVSGS
jgi:hypothetical protein